MADNVAVTEGAGKSIATDDVGGQQYQRVKLDFGTDGVAAPALAGTGAMATGVQRVTLATDDPAVVDLAAIEALLITIDSDTSKITACNTGAVVLSSGTVTTVSTVTNLAQMSGTAIAMNEGVLAAGVQRVTLATDDDAVAHLATIAGDTTNIETAIQLLDNAVDGNYLNVNLNVAGTDAAAGEGVISAQTQRVTIATDDDSVAHLATIAGDTTSLDTKVTACNTGAVVISSGTVTTVSTVTTLSQLGGQAISMGEGVLAAGCQRVTLATDDDGVAHLATIAGDTTNIETAIQIIDDWDATHAGAAVADGPQIMGAGYSAALPTDVGADADAARICTDRHGRILRGVMPQNFQATFTSADAQAATPVKAKTADRKMYILSLVVSVDTAMNVQFQDDINEPGPTILIEGMYFAANGGAHLTWPAEAPLVVNTNEDFDVITSAAGNISVTITGYLAV